jgi:eukaryotic-like serine/threonine-protein kinase
MTTESGALLRELFDAVVELPPDAREAALRERCNDEKLIREVLGLCKAGDRAHTARLHAGRDAMLVSMTAPALTIGETLGPWRIVGEIGHGGMGLVYRVERSDGHYAQTAALKFIAGAPGAERLAHFARERQLLARLNHPNVARLLDGGASADQRPYLVMEYVDGLHIDRWCSERHLGVQDIVRLFLQVCEAVAFAHRQLIVHCDLKPSNLLVEQTGRVVLLDFGVARLIGGLDDADAMNRSSGYTPGYASPEQRAGAAVSTASDVYSLGVVLSELLKDASDSVPAELAAVVTQASADDVARRYGSAESLAADLARYLAREPVTAVGGSRWYRARCFGRRHAMPVALSAGLVLALIIGLLLNLHSLERAERERRSAERTADFLGNVLSAVDPIRARDLDKTLMRQVLDQAARSAQAELADEPQVLATVEGVIGRTYDGIGEYGIALDYLRAAYERLPASNVRQRLSLRLRIINASTGLERPLDVLAQAEALVAEYMDVFGALDPDTLRARQIVATLYGRTYQWRKTESLCIELQPLLDQYLGVDDPVVWQNQRWLAIALGELDQYERAEQAFLGLIRRLHDRVGADDPRILNIENSLSIHYLRNGRYAQAEALLRDMYPRSLRILGERSGTTIQNGSALGSALRLGGKVAESEPWYRQALEQSRAFSGPDSSDTARYEANYANLEIDLGRPAAALVRIDRVFPLMIKYGGDHGLGVIEAWRTRGRAYTALGRNGEARNAWQQALAIGYEVYGRDDHPMTKEDRDALAALEGR